MCGKTRFLLIGAAVLGLVAAVGAQAQAQKLVRDYQFKQTLKDSAGGPELRALDGAVGDGVYSFAVGHGLELPDAGVRDHYTIEITFQFDETDGWQKILDFKSRQSDNGLYVLDGRLQFYDFGIGGNFQPGTSYRVRLERNRTTKEVRGFLNDEQVFRFTDTDGQGVFDTGAGFLFVDDVNTTEEEASGAVSRIRIWDAPGGK